jgi:thioredoxin reductase
MNKEEAIEVIIIGGSYAGLSAALALGRARRQVVVLDTGQPCNRQTPHSHNFLTQDGATPAELAAVSRAQVLAYPTVQLRNEAAVAAAGENGNFTITTASGTVLRARKLLFATGIRARFAGLCRELGRLGHSLPLLPRLRVPRPAHRHPGQWRHGRPDGPAHPQLDR